MSIGFVQIHRTFLDWEWYDYPVVSRLFIHLILKANFKDKKWQGRLVERGQLITSYGNLSAELGVGTQSIRNALSKLNDSRCIRLETTNRYSVITILNYDDYQSGSTTSNNQTVSSNNKRQTGEEHSVNKQPTTTKKGNKVNKEKIEKRKEKFRKQVFSFSNYQNEILNGFFEYWSELNNDKSKMRFEKDGFFDIDNRLKKWNLQERSYKPKKPKSKLINNRH